MHGNPEGIKHSMVCPEPSQDKDCYFDEECHAKVNWDKIKKIKEGFFAKIKTIKQNDSADEVKARYIKSAHKLFLEAGMPDDRIDYILEKWVKAAYPQKAPATKAKSIFV